MKKELKVLRLSSNFFVFFSIFLWLHPGLIALDPNKPIAQYSLNIWNVGNGLPDNSICALQQTRDGYICLGTRMEGLVRFDGDHFKVFNSSNSPLMSNFIFSLYEDRKGTLWIGTDGGGLARKNKSTFETFSTDDGLECGFIYSLYEDREGSLWVGTIMGGLHQFRDIPIKGQKEKEITIYITTDGFADQQNPQNQKFGTRRLREFLRDNAHLNASQQKEALVMALETHQANEEQRDDITVIGIRLCIG
jgi:ligand-binding sensor domain-containing protein